MQKQIKNFTKDNNILREDTEGILLDMENEELDLRKLFDMFWNKKIEIIIIILLFLIMGTVYTMFLVKPVYSSSTSLLLAGSQNTETITTTDITINNKLISTYSELIKSKSVIRKVKSNLNLDLSEDEIKKMIKVDAIDSTDLIKITVTNADNQLSEKIANKIAIIFIDEVQKYYNIDNVQVVDQAEVSEIPSNINHAKDLIMFGFAGVAVSCIVVLIINLIDTTIKPSKTIEEEFNIPVLASIPVYETSAKKGGRS